MTKDKLKALLRGLVESDELSLELDIVNQRVTVTISLDGAPLLHGDLGCHGIVTSGTGDYY